MKGILFDLDGVLYVGDRAVPGASEAIAWVRRAEIPHMFVTNTTSRPRSAIVERLDRLGIAAGEDDLLTPALAAGDWLVRRLAESDRAARPDGPPRLALFVPPATQSEFGPAWTWDPAADSTGPDWLDQRPLDAVVVGDLGSAWTFPLLNRAFELLMRQPRPDLVALGMTRFWRASDGLRLDTGPFVRALEYAAGLDAVVTGKPEAAFFLAAASHLGLPADELVMVGDDVRGDVGGAQRAGMTGVLVRTGKFSRADLEESGVTPDDVLDSVADLERWWSYRAG